MNFSRTDRGRTIRILRGDRSQFSRLLSTVDWPPTERVTVIKENANVASGFLYLGTEGDTPVFFKRFPVHRLRHRIAARLGLDRGTINWKITNYLTRNEIPVAKAEALLRDPNNIWFLTEALTTARPLSECDFSKKDSVRLAETISFGSTIGAMHNLRITHGDLKWGNILRADDGSLILVDLDSARNHQRVTNRQRAADMARYVVSGLERGLDRGWAYAVLGAYDTATKVGYKELLRTARPIVAAISYRHQQRYGRRQVRL